MMFKSYADATAYYKHCVIKQREKVAEEVKKLKEFEALFEHNRKQMEKKEAENYG